MKGKIAAALKGGRRRAINFTARQLMRSPAFVSAIKQAAAEHLDAQAIPARIVFNTPQIAAKVVPYSGNSESYVIPRTPRGPVDLAALPVPPSDQWEGYADNTEDYLHHGEAHVASMRQAMADSGFPLTPGQRLLDLGCASGRMIRFLGDLAVAGEVWGADIEERHIYWCQQHLSPPFKFVNTTTLPHLPFEDGYFDFIYAGSVFTHIAELADAWLLELRRILRPGGRLYLSVHDRKCIEVLLEKVPDNMLTKIVRWFDERTHFLETDFAVATVSHSPYAQVFYNADYLRDRWSQFMNVVAVQSLGHGIHAAVILEKAAAARRV